MPSVSATCRASYTSSSEQQRPCTGSSGMPRWPAKRRWFQSCIVSPTTLYPCAHNIAATVDESTPPDMATAMVLSLCGFIHFFFDDVGHSILLLPDVNGPLLRLHEQRIGLALLRF